tara:strand:+ start:162 stop:425 length:264 start_codon:yes stop_codon:yes gene_type:complete
MILEIILVLLAVLCVASWYGLWNTMRKMEVMEDWIDEYTTRMLNVNRTIKRLDYKEYFAEDDEVGIIFKEIEKAVNELDIEKEPEIG